MERLTNKSVSKYFTIKKKKSSVKTIYFKQINKSKARFLLVIHNNQHLKKLILK